MMKLMINALIDGRTENCLVRNMLEGGAFLASTSVLPLQMPLAHVNLPHLKCSLEGRERSY